MLLNPAQLQAATGCTAERAAEFAPWLTEACNAYGIITPDRLAAFLAQIGHESGSLKWTAELWGPTPQQRTYEGRANLGNTEPGDGARFKGRGLIQTTGRYNYSKARDRLRARFGPEVPDFVSDPSALERPRWAALSAGDYWDWRGLNALADAGDFDSITQRINGGQTGADDRRARWVRAQLVLGGPKLDTSAGRAQETPKSIHVNQPAAPPMLGDEIPMPTVSLPVAPPEPRMPIPAIVSALLPMLVESIPKLGKLFGSGSEVQQRNAKAAEMALQIAQEAVGASNAQAAVETIKADPAAAQAAAKAIEARWLELSESGGDGIAGARKADAEATARHDMWLSPSWWVVLVLLPLVYLLVLSLIGLIGSATWSDDVRAGLAGSIVSSIIGGAVGYFWGQTTSRNRTAG